MRQPIFVRPLAEDERKLIEARLRSSDAFVFRRSQILLASARLERVPSIASALSCDEQTVRNAIHAFNQHGVEALRAGSHRPHRLRTVLGEIDADIFKALLHRPPRDFGKKTSLWTLDLVAVVCVEQGWTAVRVSAETIRQTLKRLGINWKRAKHWITSPDPSYLIKKNARDRLIAWASQQSGWAIGFLDEVWWSRFALPRLHAWQSEDQPVHLEEQTWKKDDPDPKALACYGVLWQEGPSDDPARDEMWLRFVTGRPVSDITTQFLGWCCTQLQQQGKSAWLLIWDNASWHVSKQVRTWIREHNQRIKQENKGVRILPFFLPTKSPWLNPIEPKWVHGKRAVVEPHALLSAQQLAERVCAYFRCPHETHLTLAAA
ncbi:transposase [Ktedonobacteria bacterium brp13]|nr:transposase [Ktedonobacteria bacterium brp13]